jgi:O-antigen/teichoic acid export membrane protein/SAM-dependent methyltransferase
MRSSVFDLRRKLARIRNSSLARNAGWMLAGQGGNFFLQAGYFLALARLLGTTEYGMFAGAFALVSFVTPYSSLGSQMTFMRYVSADRNSAQTYWGNMLMITAISSLLLMAGLGLAGGKLLGPQSIGLIAVLVVAGFMSQVAYNASMVFQTFEQLKATAWLRLLSNLLRLLAVAVLLICLHHATAFQCSIGILISSTLAAGIAIVWIRSTIGRMRLSVSLFLARFWEGIGFSVAGSTTAVYNDVDKMMLSHYGMNAANGIYTMAYRVVDFATAPVTAIDAASVPRYFALNKEGLPAVTSMAKKLVPIAALSGLAAAACTLLVSPFLVRIVGRSFGDALGAIRWLCWLPALRGVHQLAGSALTASGRQNYRTTAQFLVAALNLTLNLAWIPSRGWLGAAWASLASDGALATISLLLVYLFLARASQNNRSNPRERHLFALALQLLIRSRIAARKILGSQLTSLVPGSFRRQLGSIADYRSHLQSKRGLEIGGPSAVLADTGPVPIYDILESLDNCSFSSSTIWTGEVKEGNTFFYHPGKQPGTQIICDATDMQPIKDSSYECVLACHCLEHVANPLRALAEWTRILKNDGLLLLILPHKDATFDWRRPTTPLAHMIEDYQNAMGEEDLTHLPEILELHDLSRDQKAGTKEQFRRRCLSNYLNRAMHHHAFDTKTALTTIDHIGLQIVRVDNLRPFHIIILASRTDRPIDNRRFLEPGGEHWSRSPFPSDHKHASR